MTHPETLCLTLFAIAVGMLETSVPVQGIKKSPTKKHFFTLPPTLEDALIQVKRYSGVKTGIFLIKSKT
jgi:hypothetical protein